MKLKNRPLIVILALLLVQSGCTFFNQPEENNIRSLQGRSVVVYFHGLTLLESTERQVVKIAENSYVSANQLLEIGFNQIINYHFYRQEADISEQYKNDAGLAVSAARDTHIIYKETETTLYRVCLHEAVHIMAFQKLILPSRDAVKIPFFIEGLAFAIADINSDFPWKTRHASLFYPNLKWVMNLNRLDFYESNQKINFYYLAGSFFYYLLQTYGLNKIKMMYSNMNWVFNQLFLNTFNKSIDIIIQEWKVWVSSWIY